MKEKKKHDIRVRSDIMILCRQRPVIGCLGVGEHEAGKQSWAEEKPSKPPSRNDALIGFLIWSTKFLLLGP